MLPTKSQLFQGLETAPQPMPVQVGYNSNSSNVLLYNRPAMLPQNSSPFMWQQKQLNFQQFQQYQQFQQFQQFQQSQARMPHDTMPPQHSDNTAVAVAQQQQQQQEPQPLEQKTNLNF